MAYTVRDLSNAQRFEYKGYEVFMYCTHYYKPLENNFISAVDNELSVYLLLFYNKHGR